jgi:hypothetical protein
VHHFGGGFCKGLTFYPILVFVPIFLFGGRENTKTSGDKNSTGKILGSVIFIEFKNDKGALHDK